MAIGTTVVGGEGHVITSVFKELAQLVERDHGIRREMFN